MVGCLACVCVCVCVCVCDVLTMLDYTIYGEKGHQIPVYTVYHGGNNATKCEGFYVDWTGLHSGQGAAWPGVRYDLLCASLSCA